MKLHATFFEIYIQIYCNFPQETVKTKVVIAACIITVVYVSNAPP